MDYRKELEKQLIFLRNSSRLYDEGCALEAIRIATTIRVLLHKTNQSTPLLEHLGALDVNLLRTGGKRPGDWMPAQYVGLGMHRFGPTGGIFFPPLGFARKSETVPASDWWSDIVYVNDHHPISRKDIVLAASNKDGGAHVDPKWPAAYTTLARPGSIGYYFAEPVDGSGERITRQIENVHLVALRQMAYELLHSPDLLALQ